MLAGHGEAMERLRADSEEWAEWQAEVAYAAYPVAGRRPAVHVGRPLLTKIHLPASHESRVATRSGCVAGSPLRRSCHPTGASLKPSPAS